MASRADVMKAQQGTVLQAPTTPGFSQGGGSTQQSSQFTGIQDPEALKILMDTIRQLSTGGTAEYKRQQAQRTAQVGSARGEAAKYTKEAAFADAADLMAQQLRVALEKNMPAISKAIQGAGTSSSSMQGLLSQKLATESAQAAGALGAQQAVQYGNIQSALQGVLEGLTRVDNSNTQALVEALKATQTSRQASSQVSNPTTSVTASGGGSYIQPFDYSPGRDQSVMLQQTNQGVAPAQTAMPRSWIPGTPEYAAAFYELNTPSAMQEVDAFGTRRRTESIAPVTEDYTYYGM